MVTPPLVHQSEVLAVTWSADRRYMATASEPYCARLGRSGDTGTVADWRNAFERGDYRLHGNGILVVRDPKAISVNSIPVVHSPAPTVHEASFE